MEKFIPIIVAILLATSALALEAVVNGDFESGSVDPWTFNADWTVSTTNPHGGTYCALGDGNNYIHQEFTPIPVDNVISMIAWLKQPEVFHFKIRLYYGPSDFDQSVDIIVPDANWNQYDMIVDLRTTGELEAIRFYGYSGGGGPDPDYTYLDDVTITHSGYSAVESASLGELKAVFR